MAHIVDITEKPQAITGFDTFSIVKSRGSATRQTLISPDVRVCDDCLAEMRDPNDRRFGYPFINCILHQKEIGGTGPSDLKILLTCGFVLTRVHPKLPFLFSLKGERLGEGV